MAYRSTLCQNPERTRWCRRQNKTTEFVDVDRIRDLTANNFHDGRYIRLKVADQGSLALTIEVKFHS